METSSIFLIRHIEVITSRLQKEVIFSLVYTYSLFLYLNITKVWGRREEEKQKKMSEEAQRNDKGGISLTRKTGNFSVLDNFLEDNEKEQTQARNSGLEFFKRYQETLKKTSSNENNKSPFAMEDSGKIPAEDSRSDSGSSMPGIIRSEESRLDFMRHSVDQDSRLGAHNDEDFLDVFGDEYDPAKEEEEMLQFKKDIENATATDNLSQNNGGKKRFRFMVPGPKRSDSQVMESAEEWNINAYPRRVLIADHVKRFFSKKRPVPVDKRTGKPLKGDYYEFLIYSSVYRVIEDLQKLPLKNKTLFVVAEENGSVMTFLDLEIPTKWLDQKRHGTSLRNHFGYCIAVVRSILSSILGRGFFSFFFAHCCTRD